MKRLILGLFMIFGMAVNGLSAKEAEFGLYQQAQKEAKEAIDGYERFKAKYPKIHKACFDRDTNSKYYYDSVCDYLFQTFTAMKFKEREDGTRYAISMDWRELEKDYGGCENGKKILLKYGIHWRNAGGVSDLPLAESFAKSFSNRVCKGQKTC